MSRAISRARRVGLTAAGGLLTIAVLAGCSSDNAETDTGAATSPSESTSTTTGTSSADVCADLDTAKASLQTLVDTNIAQEGTNTLKTRFATFESDVQTLLQSGQEQLAPKTAAVKGSIATLKDTLAGLKENPTAADLALVKPSLQAVELSTQDLITALEDTC